MTKTTAPRVRALNLYTVELDGEAVAQALAISQAEAAAAMAGGKIVAKYRDPATGQTWSGRGLRPRWLVQAISDGLALDEFLIENQGAQV